MVIKVKMKKCRSCSEPFKPFSSTQTVCGMVCALDYAAKKSKKKDEDKFKATKKAFYDNDRAFQRAKAVKMFNRFIRIRDKDLNCVSCNKDKYADIQWHAGHYHTVGARPDLEFNEDNVHKQCSRCNNFLSANLLNYKAELEKRIGKKRLNMLESVTSKKYTANDFKEIYDKYRLKIKELLNEQN